MNEPRTIITFILDESGSMNPARDATISGFNEFLDAQKDKALGVCVANLVKFSYTDNTVFAEKAIDDVPYLDRRSYCPEGTTALYDAIDAGIYLTQQQYEAEKKVMEKLVGKEVDVEPLVIFVIMTDGGENSSRRTNRSEIFNKISSLKAKGWSFVFIGAEIDSFATGASLGISAGNIANFTRTAAGTGAAFHNLASQTASKRSLYAQSYSVMASTDATGADKTAAAAHMKAIQHDYFSGKKDLSDEHEG